MSSEPELALETFSVTRLCCKVVKVKGETVDFTGQECIFVCFSISICNVRLAFV